MSYKIKYSNNTTKEFDTLVGADLSEANLSRAYLSEAYLVGANLVRANLYRAKGIITFQAGRHFGFSYWYNNTPYVQIGCRNTTLKKALTVEKDEPEYSKTETFMYREWLRSLDSIYKKGYIG